MDEPLARLVAFEPTMFPVLSVDLNTEPVLSALGRTRLAVPSSAFLTSARHFAGWGCRGRRIGARPVCVTRVGQPPSSRERRQTASKAVVSRVIVKPADATTIPTTKHGRKSGEKGGQPRPMITGR